MHSDKSHESPRMSALALAAQNGHDDIVQLLVAERCIQLNTVNRKGLTPLALATQHGHVNSVKLLLAKENIDPDFRLRNGHTLTSLAVANGRSEVMRLLLATKCIDTSEKAAGRTLLGWARYAMRAKRRGRKFYKEVQKIVQDARGSQTSEDRGRFKALRPRRDGRAVRISELD
jgi:ankyrin repeat protein